ncbi:aldehyde oxidase [Spirochaetia bacterium]|nr:aldehyde oxidase [Spirochaetia bacterium]
MEKPPFVDDITIKHCLTGILLRSPVQRGILKEIQTPKLPYNVSLITASDIPGNNILARPADHIPVFPQKELSYYGQPAAMLLGPDPARLRELAEQCTVLAEPAENIPVEKIPAEEQEKIILERNYDAGSVDEAFEKAETVVEGNYSTGLEDPWPSDPLGAIAVPGDGTMTIHTASQWPGHVKASVARTLTIKTAAVEVELTRLEIHLDGKLWTPSLIACQAAAGAWVKNKAVKLVLRRDEDFLFSPKSVPANIHIQTALGKRGQILGTRVTITANFGAAGVFAAEILDRIALGALGAYSHGSICLRARGISTALPPAGPLAGFGLAQGFFAAEQHASRIAGVLGEDPAEWRKNFFLRKGRKLPIGTEIREEPPPEALLDSVSAMSDYRRKWASNDLLRKNRRENPALQHNLYEGLRGIGIALAYQGSSFLYDCRTDTKPEGVELTLEKDGALEIRTTLPWGDNQIHSWRTLAAKILGVETVRIISKSGAKAVPESGPACLSRSIAVITSLVEKACTAIRKQRFRDPLPITVHRYYHPAKARAWGGGEIYDGNALSPLSWGSAVVEAEIDPVDYTPRIRGIWMTLEGGTILAEERARKSTTIHALQALSWAMGEKAVYMDGKAGALRDYHLPRMTESQLSGSPPVTIDFLWSEGSPRGIGELPYAAVPAAYAQALSQALDYPFQSYPVDGEEIWKAVQNLGDKE